MTYLYLLLTLAIGTLAGLLINKLKVPGGLLVGAIVGAALLNICLDAAYMPNQTKLLVQIIAGAFIGCSMEKSDVKRLPKIIKPTIIMISALLVLNLVAGVLIHLSSPLDLVTSFMSVVPGGISDTPIIAAVMGADGSKVAVMQIVRQVLGIGVFPLLISTYDNRRKKTEEYGFREAYKEERQKSKTKSWTALVCTLIVAAIFGLIGNKTGIPAGAFVFSILSVLILKLRFDFAYMPKWLKKFAQILSGCYLGSTIVMSDVLELRFLLVPLFIIIIGYMANCFITGFILSKTCGFTRKEAMLITTPAGASDMALISSDMGVENTDVIILQILRAVIVMTFFPQIINLILYFVGG
ncbi:AbrB family transcriptional regulator [Dehalobacter restrictus]|uniref:AbrB family transcriptional regulator n=1 Tax=Dehalobacter restrictus TaxID=55583 RepID=UPI0033904204